MRKVKHRAGHHHVCKGVWKRRRFYGFHPEIVGRKAGRKPARVLHRLRIGVHSKDLVTLFEKIDQITAGTTSRIEDSHAGQDAAPQELVKEVDVDLAELLAKKRHGYSLMVRDNANR